MPDGLLEALEQDERRAARELARAIRDRREKNRSEGQRLRNLLRYEVELWDAGHLHVAGVDEAGMAPLAGPVVAAAVILPRNYKLRGIDDSKVLDPETRERMALVLKRDAVAWAVGVAEVEEIDRINIYHAGLLAMRRALLGLASSPSFVLVDARRIPECPVPQRGIVHGDALSLTIAAASIIAKTTRDAHMAELDAPVPGLRLRRPQGLPHAPARDRAARARRLSHPSAELRAGAPGARARPRPGAALRAAAGSARTGGSVSHDVDIDAWLDGRGVRPARRPGPGRAWRSRRPGSPGPARRG